MKLQDRLVRALELRGCTRVASRSTKYLVLTSSVQDEFYFVGKNGALRKGKTVTDSFPCSDLFKQRLLNGVA